MGKDKRDRDRKKTTKVKKQVKKKICTFCANKVDDIDYKDVVTLKRYVNEKHKIAARRATGACARHERRIATAIKRARCMALLSYCTSR
ncbi:MAG: 30S ribosomal protein S18 [Candidatus Riflebacteria bacterium]|nr:30S ribosomal protein S18 [Candidatus Riflebacteria bacterium]